MKIELIKLKFNDAHSYKYKPFTHCCDEIQNDKAIIFTDEDLIYSDDCRDDERYIPRFCTSYTEVITSYEDEWVQTDKKPSFSARSIAKRLCEGILWSGIEKLK